MTEYIPRAIVPAIQSALRVLPVVVLTGMRQTGTSTLLLQDARLAGRRYRWMTSPSWRRPAGRRTNSSAAPNRSPSTRRNAPPNCCWR